jgi:hypothetical protein
VPIEELAVGLDDRAGRWFRAEAGFVAEEEDPAFPFARRIRVEGFQALTLVYYPPKGKEWIDEVVEIGLVETKAVQQIRSDYPSAAIDAAARDLVPGERIEITGRLWFDSDRAPLAVFEIWAIASKGRPESSAPEKDPESELEPGKQPPKPEPSDPARAVARPEWDQEGDDPDLDGLSLGELAEAGRRALERARSFDAEDRDLHEARRHLLAAYHRDRKNLYLIDLLLDIEDLLAARREED